MRIATIFFPTGNPSRLTAIAQGLSQGMERQGHQVDLIDGVRDGSTRLSIYGYVAIGVEQSTLITGRIPERVAQSLASRGIVGGRPAFAFVLRRPFGSDKALGRLMQAMEHEGLFLRTSSVIKSAAEAQVIGARLRLN